MLPAESTGVGLAAVELTCLAPTAISGECADALPGHMRALRLLGHRARTSLARLGRVFPGLSVATQ